jgi:hypothetical protein
MILHNFWLSATALTATERQYAQLPAHLQPEELQKKIGTAEFPGAYLAQAIELGRLAEAERARECEKDSDRRRFIRPRIRGWRRL